MGLLLVNLYPLGDGNSHEQSYLYQFGTEKLTGMNI